jgi:PDZ domain/Aspartyl protease
MKSFLPITIILLFGWFKPLAQPGYEILKNVNKIEIPFDLTNDLILIKVTFGRIFPLTFIFDTGAENSILSDRTYTDMLDMRYEREFKLIGSDMRTEITAYLVRGIYLNIENMVVPSHSMLVLDQDYFNFEELLGIPVHGIIGADLFKGLIVKINYDKKVITLTKSGAKKSQTAGMQSYPIKIEKNKPYLNTTIKLQNDSTVNVKLLLDTGAMLSLLLNSDSHPDLKPPPNTIAGNIGMGIGGVLNGHLGRIKAIQVGYFQCNEVITNFQTLDAGMDTTMLYGRNGVIGNGLLSKFLVIIDYPAQKLYLQPNKQFKNDFEFDKSGLIVIAADYRLNQFLVHSVLPNSPAQASGILPGDEIKRINRSPAGMLSLIRINQLLRKKEGKNIVIVVNRNGERLKFEFRLKKLI